MDAPPLPEPPSPPRPDTDTTTADETMGMDVDVDSSTAAEAEVGLEAAAAAPTPACAALFPHLVAASATGADATDDPPKKSKWVVPPLPLPILLAFERWLSGVPSPQELLALGSAPPPEADE